MTLVGASVHEAQTQGLKGRQIHAPAVLAALAVAFDRRIVAVECRLPPDLVAAQADRARQRGVELISTALMRIPVGAV